MISLALDMGKDVTGLASLSAFALCLAFACSGDEAQDTEVSPSTESLDPALALPPEATEEDRERARLDAAFPKHGAVKGVQLRVHTEPNEEATVVGWLRIGSRVRLSAETESGHGCRAWHRIHPSGWVCGNEGLEIRDEEVPIENPTDLGWRNDQVEEAAARGVLVLPPAARDERMPYDYFYVKESTVPEYHRLPSRDEQRRAGAKATRYRELYQLNEDRARRYLAGNDDGPAGTAVTHRYLERRFYVASNGVEVRASRRFVRTTQGRYIKSSRLETRNGHTFHGVELSAERQLPIAWTNRRARPRLKVEGDDGTIVFDGEQEIEPWDAQTLLEGWQERRNIGGTVVHVIETERGERYLRHFYASVARAIERPAEVGEDEPWVHVDISEQTLVLYHGDTPVYATLVSTGVEGHETPLGVFEIRRKLVTDTMANLGEGTDDVYRIEDVPWTQYFEGSFALHTAFWHVGFGQPRSHGCVNMTPDDAHRVFGDTWPELPAGWHGLSTDRTEHRGSHVVVTE